jgi:hypothetical protein
LLALIPARDDYTVRLGEAAEVDAEPMDWIRTAYDACGVGSRPVLG